MEGYDVVGIDDNKIGRVVGATDDLLIIERGVLRKHRTALPREFAHVEEAAQVVRVTVDKDIIAKAPEVDGDEPDRSAIAAYYGLGEAADTTTTDDASGTGVSTSAEEDARRLGITTGEDERLNVRSGSRPRDGADDMGHSPGVTGGDRFADAEATGEVPER
jgi:hypothetical protein